MYWKLRCFDLWFWQESTGWQPERCQQ